MRNFDIASLTAAAYARFPEAQERPVIGITANHEGIDATLREAYCRQIVAAGGTPLIIPAIDDAEVIINTLSVVDGIVLSGGGDYNPLWCGEEPSPKLHNINAVRDRAELLTTRLAYNRQIPMLGICRGIQTLAMALGGHVEQDNSHRATVKHSQDADREEPTHTVMLASDSTIHTIYNKEKIAVNSFHHQVVDEPGKHFRATVFSADGMIEAIESTEHKAVMGVQWHPEWLEEDGLPLFQWIVARAAEYRKACRIHDRHLILDTHCDTPMFFHQGVDFTQRDPRILVDLHKMTEGRQDATFMVCYLPQPKEGQRFADLVHFDVQSPTDYADFIFDKIGEIVRRVPDYLAFARTPDEMLANKRAGRKSIVLGIENGLALNHDINNIEHFADRGVTYITLCHNGDNDICDSARGSQTHGGVSEFGEKVIGEMNRLGIMVDLSHAAESSFYDALQMSRTPIVCSHSNCRALCDHPRNLTDDQLRALAKAGGVAHTTFYPGFLKQSGTVLPTSANKTTEADILDAVAHLEHAISIMGIDHVGIGTDFDGDGGVPGMANAAEIINFTKQLLRRRYSEEDISKIWGGNWLRVMTQVQNAACK